MVPNLTRSFPSELVPHDVIQLIKALKIGSTSCVYNITTDYFSNDGAIPKGPYLDNQICIYNVHGSNADAELTLEYKIEEMVNIKTSEGKCIDSLTIYYNNNIDMFNDQICGRDFNRHFQIPTGHFMLLLLTDRGGKYSVLNNHIEKYKTYTGRELLKCCASDCDSNLKCSCPDDNGYFYASLQPSKLTGQRSAGITQISDQTNCLNGTSESWTTWMSASQPSGVKIGGIYVAGGEFETIENLRSQYAFCSSEKILNVQCRTRGTNHTQFDNSISCDKNGLRCVNRMLGGKR